jgi:predicted outer membrane protein
MHAECRTTLDLPAVTSPATSPSASWRHRTATMLALPFVTLCAFAALPAAVAAASPAGSTLRADGALPQGWTQTPSGPLSPADRDLLVRVRLAGLWERPAGEMAQEHTTNQKVRDVGQHLATDHTALDEQVRSVAAKLGVELPNEPNADQKGWLNEMSGARDADFDQIFTNRLRVAHGKVFSVVAAVRAGTQNDLIRTFAQTGISVVMKHMTLLESIGLVSYSDLPTPPPPALAASNLSSRASSTSTGINPDLIWLVLGIALIAGLVTAARVIRPR